MKRAGIAVICLLQVACSSLPYGSDTSPRFSRGPNFRYPVLSRYSGEEGRVELKARILPDGSLGEVSIEKSSGSALLDRTAIAGTKAAKLVSKSSSEIASRGHWVRLPVEFRLGKEGLVGPPAFKEKIIAIRHSDGLSSHELEIQPRDLMEIHSACYRFVYGLGVARDFAKAAAWCELGTEKNIPSSIALLAQLNYWGHGLPQDRIRARTLYEKAAKLGLDHAQFVVSVMYWLGEGGPRNRQAAKDYAKQAAEQGHKSAHRLLKEYALLDIENVRGTRP